MKIVLAERDKSLIEILQMILKSFKHEVVVCQDAADTLAAIKTETPDLILIDRNLKGDNGIELSRVIKGDFLTGYIPIIVLIDRKQVRKELLSIEQGIDDYIIKPPDPIDLQVRIELAVRRATHQFFANALTRLPGNRTIEETLRRLIQEKEDFTFGYVNIDRFKYFNDRYGYLKGDIVIIQTSQIIAKTVKEFGNPSDFVGHIGGDDFIFITSPDKEKKVAFEIIKEFDRLMPYHYSKKDRSRGYFQVRDRQGKLCDTQLMSVSIALISSIECQVKSLITLSEMASEIKKHLKTVSGSKFLKNRRVADSGLPSREGQVDKIRKVIERMEKANIKKPLGQLLVEAKLLDEEMLEQALVRHWRSGRSLGETLLSMGIVSEDNIFNMLKLQGAVQIC